MTGSGVMSECQRRFSGLCRMLVMLSAWASVEAQSPAMVEDIVVTGNQRIERETITSYMTLEIGDAVDLEGIDESLKSLFATGLFADVSIDSNDGSLVVRVVENPIVNRIAFEGNRALDSEQLEAELQLMPRRVYTRTKVRSDVARILELYRRAGRFSATVRPMIIEREQNRVDLVFEIDEGERTRVREINIIGNRAFSDGRLREELATKESAWWRFLSSDDTYDPDRLAFDRESLRRFYLSRGFADFRVLSTVADLTANRQDFFITFTIEEGPRYRFGEVDIQSELPGVEPADVEDWITTETGDWYDADAVQRIVEDLGVELGNRGISFAAVRPVAERDRDARTVDVTYRIEEGERFYLERIDIVGNFRTEDQVIRREMRLAEGDAFNLARLQRSERQIRALGFFDSVEITTEPGSRDDTVIVTVEVAERSTGELVLGAGYSTIDKAVFSLNLKERNLLGTGQRVGLDLAVSGRRQTIDASYTDPYFLDRRLSAGINVYRRDVDLQSESSIDQLSTGFVTHAAYPVTEELGHSVRYTLDSTRIGKVGSGASQLIRDEAGSVVTSMIGHELDYDTRDDALDPRSGYRLRLGQDLAGLGGDNRFLRHRARGAYHQPFGEEWVGTLRLEGGIVSGLLGRSVRFSDRFFLGGSSLRGFAWRGVGPRDIATDDSLGGNVYWTASAEVAAPLGLPPELGLTFHTFTDWGSLHGLDKTAPTVRDDKSVRGSGGVGFTYASPLGPMRFEFVRALAKQDYDKPQFFRFSIGADF